MKITEISSKTAAPASPGPGTPEPGDIVGGSSSEAPQEPQFVVETTPNGTDILYQWAPKRLYKIGPDRIEVPSVTTVLGVLDKSGPLTWWGMKIGVEGVLALLDQGAISSSYLEEYGGSADEIVDLLTEHKLTVNHAKDKASDRGVNVHDALEEWCKTGIIPNPNDWPETERGYIEGLFRFVCAIMHDATVDGMELTVGSLQHLYAGRFDLVLTLSQPVEVVTRTYPTRADKTEEIPAGRYLLDLKTSKRVYDTHYLQLEAYEAAAVECGYTPTNYRGVIHVTDDGRYELAVNRDWTFEDFLAVRRCYQVMNERSVVQALRDELGAKEVAA